MQTAAPAEVISLRAYVTCFFFRFFVYFAKTSLRYALQSVRPEAIGVSGWGGESMERGVKISDVLRPGLHHR